MSESLIELAEAEVAMEALEGVWGAAGGGTRVPPWAGPAEQWLLFCRVEVHALLPVGVAATSAEMYFSCSKLAEGASLEPPVKKDRDTGVT